MKYKIGSARSDENKKYSGGKPGDQRQTALFDDKGEVSIQDFYVSPKGWMCLTPISNEHKKKLAERMFIACCNKNVGYSQSDRYGIIKLGTGSKIPCNTDCSSLVRRCVMEATGIDPGDFNTANEVSVLMKTGLFEKKEYVSGMKLPTGTILVTKTKGHTVIVTEGEPVEEAAKTYPKYKGTSESFVDALKAVGETDTTKKHRTAIAAANGIDKYTGSAAQNSKLMQLLKNGKLKMA